MLTELRIAGLGVISEAVIEPHPGFTVVTGETGAGKTMVVTGLGLVAGERADSRLVRAGATKALVEARFTDIGGDVLRSVLAAGADLDDGELLVARQVGSRTRTWVGGIPLLSAAASEMGAGLVTIHGQSEQVRLGTAERQREVLDRAGGPSLASVLSQYRAAYGSRRTAQNELTSLVTQAQARAREIDLLTFGLDEIARIEPLPGEDMELAAEANRLQSVDDLRVAARRAAVALAGDDDSSLDQPSVLGLVAVARKALEQAATADPCLESLANQSRELAGLAADVAAETASYLADLDADPARLEWIAARRSDLQGLTRKYGQSVDEVLQWADASAKRLTELQGGDDRIQLLTSEVERLTDQVTSLASQLTELRQEAAERFAALVELELAALAMPRARLRFEVAPLPEPGPHGADAVTLLFSANPGSEPAPLGKIASGGELSRVRLALEVVLAEGDADPTTFVFDEVDAGIGGSVALEVGRRLARLARSAQVIVVTHLAQVAAYADRHVVVAKTDDGSVTTSGLVQLADAERPHELARMMGGLDGTDSSLAHASELVAQAARDKEAL